MVSTPLAPSLSAMIYYILYTQTVLGASSGCPCLAAYPSGVDPTSTNVDGRIYNYPATYGLASCTAHDSGLLPYCHDSANAASWCADSWCYVDIANCDKRTQASMYFASFVHFSYATCTNDTDVLDACEARGSFVDLNFNTSLILSNLGGFGASPTDTSWPQDIRLGPLGLDNEGQAFDLHIRNESEYLAWNPALNGIVHKAGGSFGSINLRAPRGSDWHDDVTFVDLNFSFVKSFAASAHAQTSSPSTLGHTFLTFYDLDTANDGASTECVQLLGGDASGVAEIVSSTSELGVTGHETLAALIAGDGTYTSNESRPVYSSSRFACGAVKGIGDDNPTSPSQLTGLERNRAIMFEMHNVSGCALCQIIMPAALIISAALHSQLHARGR